MKWCTRGDPEDKGGAYAMQLMKLMMNRIKILLKLEVDDEQNQDFTEQSSDLTETRS